MFSNPIKEYTISDHRRLTILTHIHRHTDTQTHRDTHTHTHTHRHTHTHTHTKNVRNSTEEEIQKNGRNSKNVRGKKNMMEPLKREKTEVLMERNKYCIVEAMIVSSEKLIV